MKKYKGLIIFIAVKVLFFLALRQWAKWCLKQQETPHVL